MKTVAAFLLVLCYLAGSHAWNCREGPRLSSITQIDAGLGKVVAVNRFNQAFVLIGTRWYRLSSVSLKHISVGPAGMWGASNTNRVYKSVAGNMLQSSGLSLQQVDAGGDGQVVGVSVGGSNTLCLRESFALAYKGVGSLSWSSLGRAMRYYSCSPNNGCWGVDTSFRVYFTQRIVPSNCGTSGWLYVAGQSMTMIEVGTDGSVFGVNRSGQVFQRIGISIRLPQGSAWRSVPMCMSIRHVSYDLGRLWAVTTSGLLMQCTH
ncbi:fish-egg lectin-like [Seriola aureovittata]|uniref:fish-egg lectin-like n=1 Tax=Seriola aureovittata TaxID=2871759 RepID=UPI0024BE9873|nr:fish-egg lectin-like [Seriola aureovittata]